LRHRVVYATRTASHALVKEIWALRGVEAARAETIADNADVKLHWVDALPAPNGESSVVKLEQERDILVLRNRTSPFISQFEHPLGRCAKFYKLSAYNNCNYWCEYCYLYLTFRTRPFSIHYANYERLFREIAVFDKADIPPRLRMLNLGELGDPLAIDDVTAFSKVIIPFVTENTARTSLLFLTKSACVDNLLELDGQGRVAVSFSVNTDKVAKHLEHRAPPVGDRLLAARRVQDAGYEIRLRIDPVFYYSTWERDYAQLVDDIADTVKPSVVTIGEYRPACMLGNHIRLRFPDSPLLKIERGLVKDHGKLRYPPERRHAMFAHIVARLRHRGITRIGLCKEGAESWRAAGLNGTFCCNCLL